MAASVITDISRNKMLRARAGIAPLPRIAGMAFGDGAHQDGSLIIPQRGENSLKNELLRKPIDGVTEISHLRFRYTCTLGKDELADQDIDEYALYDSDGDLVVIRACGAKYKDDDMEMAFEIDDSFEEG